MDKRRDFQNSEGQYKWQDNHVTSTVFDMQASPLNFTEAHLQEKDSWLKPWPLDFCVRIYTKSLDICTEYKNLESYTYTYTSTGKLVLFAIYKITILIRRCM